MVGLGIISCINWELGRLESDNNVRHVIWWIRSSSLFSG
jgi:hypothetical protein